MSYRGRGRGNYSNYNQTNYQGNGHGQGFGQTNNQGNLGGNFDQNINQFVSMNSVPVEIGNWDGAAKDECIKFISRKCRIAVTDSTVLANGNLRGFVKSEKEAAELIKWNGVKFAGKSLKISKNYDPNGNPPSRGSENAIDTLTQFLKSRYQADIKMLNLSNVQSDPTLTQQGFFTTISTTSKFFPALMKVASGLKLEVESIDLSMNNLTDLYSVSSLAQTFPRLVNLSLMNNNIDKIKSFEIWKHKLNYLRELIIAHNPIVAHSSPDIIKGEMARLFPRLIIVNAEVIRNEAALLGNLKFQFTNYQQMFFQDQDIQQMSTNFVTNFYNLWDSNRGNLAQLYQNESQFSVSVDMANPHDIANNNIDFSYYLPLSRNLTKISTPKIKATKLAIGNENIIKNFYQLPKSKHELINKPHLFTMEVFRFNQLGGIVINLHGTFQELSPPEHDSNTMGPKKFNRPKRVPLSDKGFDRCFVVVPGQDGSMIIASDSLIIRNPCDFKPSIIETTPPPSSSIPQPPPTTTQSLTVNDLSPEIKNMLNVTQQELLVKVVLETNLNLQYGYMLCEQSNWDYQQCIVNFKSSVGTLPPDAYR